MEPMYMRLRFHARLVIDSRLVVREYTGRLVKGFASTCSPALRDEFAVSTAGRPKRVSVSPLIRVEPRGVHYRLEAVYPGGPSRDSVKEPVLNPGDTVFFDISLSGGLVREADTLLDCFAEGVDVRFQGVSVHLEPISAEIVAAWTPGEEPLVNLERVGRLKLVFLSPALPVNPWRPGSRHKRLLPAPSYILAVNAHDLFDDQPRRYEEALIAAERVLSPPHTALSTVRIRWFRYARNTKPEPGLVGYLNLYVDRDGAGDEELMLASQLLTHALIMGIGSGRATGFGTIGLEETGDT